MRLCSSPRCGNEAIVRLVAIDPRLAVTYIGATDIDGALRMNLCGAHRHAFGYRPVLTLPDGVRIRFLVTKIA